MEPRQPMPSVIAKLMGLEEFPPQQPVQKKARVFSDKYLQRVRSISTRGKHQQRGYQNSVSERSREYNVLERDKQNGISAGKRKAMFCPEVSLSASNYKSFGDSLEISSGRNQWYNGSESCRDFSMNDGWWSGLNDGLTSSTDRTVVPVPHTRKVENAETFLVSNQKHRSYTMRALVHGIRPTELRSSSSKRAAKTMGFVKSNMHTEDALGGSRFLSSCTSSSKAELASLSSYEQVELGRSRIPAQELIIPGHGLKSTSLRCNPDEYHFGSLVSGKSSQYGWKVRRIGCLHKPVPLYWDLSAIRDGMLSNSHDNAKSEVQMSNIEFINLVLHKSSKQDSNQKYSSKSRFSRKSYEKPSSGEVLEVGNKNLDPSFMTPKTGEKILEKYSHSLSSDGYDTAVLNFSMSSEHSVGMDLNGTPSTLDEQSLHMEKGSFLAKDQDDSSHIIDSSVQKDSILILEDKSARTYEKESISHYGSCTDPESVLSVEEAYQSSPISVLDTSFRKETSSCSESWDGADASLHGLHLRLEMLKSDTSEDGSSEDFDTMVSSEGDAQDTEADAMRVFRGEESRDFSYLVDVLTEGGFLNGDPFMGVINSWKTEECIISPSVFETLEKKYGGQTCWKKSERRLLFDRMNLGLIEILQSSWTQHSRSNPVARRLILSHGQEDIEEELWMLLASQENGAGNDSEKVLGKDDKWLELGVHVQDVSTEIANSLFDELVEDVLST